MAVRPPEPVLAAVAEAAARGGGSVEAAGRGLRWAPPDQWHLTLQFLGPLPRLAPVVEGLGQATRDRAAFPFRFGGAGAFPTPRRARVVWIGAAEGRDDIVALAQAVAAGLGPAGHEPEGRPFRPHLTLARLRVPGDVGPVLAAIGGAPVGEAFTVGEVVLYESRLSAGGPAYSVLERFPLRGA